MKNITKTSELFILFSLKEKYFYDMKDPSKFDENFEKIQLVKKRGGVRIVINVKNEIYVRLLRYIRDFLNSEFSFPDYAQGFIKGRGIFTNASHHLNKKVVINVDIKDFFPSIKLEQVTSIMREIGFSNEVAEVLTEIVTLQGEVPAGFHTSPVLANLVFRGIDTQLNLFAKNNGYIYTRYADDMTFSSDSLDYIITKKDLNLILNPHGFFVNDNKYKIQYRGNKQYVTGLTVVDKKTPRIPRKIKRNMRLELYYIKKYGIDGVRTNVYFGDDLFRILKGWFGYAMGIKEHAFVNLLKRFGKEIGEIEVRKRIDDPRSIITSPKSI